MIYLTGQLLLFLVAAAFVGFLVGWFTRGAVGEALRGARLSPPAYSSRTAAGIPSDASDDIDDLLWFKSDAGRS